MIESRPWLITEGPIYSIYFFSDNSIVIVWYRDGTDIIVNKPKNLKFKEEIVGRWQCENICNKMIMLRL